MSSEILADPIQRLLEQLGDEVEDVDEETFILFSHVPSSQDLGMLAPRAEEVDISIAGRDFTIAQSPGILRSNRETGTTGAAVWRASVEFAQWLSLPSNVLFESGVLGAENVVLELGSGISALVPSVLKDRVGRMIASDQQYALRLLQANIAANVPVGKTKAGAAPLPGKRIEVLALDWETDDTASLLRAHRLDTGVDAILVCDCIFNYALIEPLVETCADLCKARSGHEREHGERSPDSRPTVCVLAQQLRQPDVFEHWLRAMLLRFRVWRVPDRLLSHGLEGGSGFVVYLALLRPLQSLCL